MRVLLVNGSPREAGCTCTALGFVAEELEAQGIETKIFQLGTDPIEGCRACNVCFKQGSCIIDDIVNEFAEEAKTADGFVFGSPVHFASAGGKITSFMDRLFYSTTRGRPFSGKPAAALVSCRRGGSTAALDQLYKYLAYSHTPIVSGQYWNMIHGNTPDEVRQDLEGVQIMRTIGRNMAWLLQCIKAGKDAGIEFPKPERTTYTNFIR